MKKLLATACILLTFSFIATDAIAQRSSGFGIRGGVNFANLNDTDIDTDSRTGLMVGAYTNFLISNSPISIQPEVLYTQKGYEFDGLTAKMDYIEVPVLVRFDFITDGGLLPFVYFGPAIGFNVNAEIDDEDIPENPDLPGPEFEDSVKDTEFSVVVGGGLDFGRFDIGVRYGAGLTNAFESGSAKNGVFSITAGVGF